MKLVKKPGSSFWWYDFRFQGKRYRGSTGEKTNRRRVRLPLRYSPV
jgi:hypothetical protein